MKKTILSLLMLLAASLTAVADVTYSQELYKKAINGDAEAQCNLGVCYENGNGVPQDYSKDCSAYIDQILSEDYEECLTIDNADVTTEYLSVGSDHNGYKGLNLVNCYVASPANGVVGDVGCIMVNGQDWQGHVEIKRSATASDVNGDGHVSSVDITAIYNYLLNNNLSTIVNGDQNGDGHISSVDVTVVYNILLGN